MLSEKIKEKNEKACLPVTDQTLGENRKVEVKSNIIE